jgi:hypothetical protein
MNVPATTEGEDRVVLPVSPLFRTTEVIAVRKNASPVEHTVAGEWKRHFAPTASVEAVEDPATPAPRTLGIVVGHDSLAAPALAFRLHADGSGYLRVSHAQWLYLLFSLVVEKYATADDAILARGFEHHPAFPWFRNLNDFLVGSLRTDRTFDPASYMRQIARQGFGHVTVNGLGVPRPFESGPPGDVYSWFYDYSPDLDQFVESSLLQGYYPSDYIQANLRALQRNVRLARAYGLVPGLHINSPRSMPDEFWHRYGHLRGARIDHPRETRRPRYTLAMAHPRVQDHYREMMRKILAEVPDLGFIHVWTNDSGAGFEFVTSLYAGRNGGPYLIREWKSEKEIARAAAANVLTYYRLLRDEGRNVNPDFRLICDLGPFYVERPFILPELGNGIDAGDFAYFEAAPSTGDRAAINAAGADVHVKLDLTDTNLPGLPFPSLVYERLKAALTAGIRCVLTGVVPASLAPYDINGEVIRAVQVDPAQPLDAILQETARQWMGASDAGPLVAAWLLADRAVRAYPADIPMSTFGFPWFRLWVRPFVPDIDAIPQAERRYYEDFLLATFNNPARVDLNNDMMWNFHTVESARERKQHVDLDVLPPIAQAIGLCAGFLQDAPQTPGATVIRDLHDRLVAARCYFTTMRNTMAWTESVQGYLQAVGPPAKAAFRELSLSMVENELDNARRLLSLWRTSTVSFMPVSALGESLHMHTDNFGELLERKIALMERHKFDEPHIDPRYMWRDE